MFLTKTDLKQIQGTIDTSKEEMIEHLDKKIDVAFKKYKSELLDKTDPILKEVQDQSQLWLTGSQTTKSALRR